MQYLIDSDVLVTAGRIYYKSSFCALFWDWLHTGHTSDVFYSIDKVKAEMQVGDTTDPTRLWCEHTDRDAFFLPSKTATQPWGQLAGWATDVKNSFHRAAQEKFLRADAADAWLIAYARAQGNFTIVTNEVSAPGSKTSIKLPDAAKFMGVSCITLGDLLSRHATSNFTFHP